MIQFYMYLADNSIEKKSYPIFRSSLTAHPNLFISFLSSSATPLFSTIFRIFHNIHNDHRSLAEDCHVRFPIPISNCSLFI